jgi:hypothetical protein
MQKNVPSCSSHKVSTFFLDESQLLLSNAQMTIMYKLTYFVKKQSAAEQIISDFSSEIIETVDLSCE